MTREALAQACARERDQVQALLGLPPIEAAVPESFEPSTWDPRTAECEPPPRPRLLLVRP